MATREIIMRSGALGLCLGCALALIVLDFQTEPPLSPAVHPPRPAVGPFEAALRQARLCRTRAGLAVNPELEAILEWDPGLSATGAAKRLREELMAADANGDLRQSHALARQAFEGAQSVPERGRAVALLARIECDRGDHEAELRWARKLMALAPDDERSKQTLRHARVCLGLECLARD